jgi:hypothetical protein
MRRFLWMAVLPLAAIAAAVAWRSDFRVDARQLGPSGGNSYFPLDPGLRLHYRHGATTMTLSVLPETRRIDGVETRVVEDREERNGVPLEITRDYYAADRATGDVYYFGEDVDVYRKGRLANHTGSWLSGVDGAKFGLMMPAKPAAGDRFLQERAPAQRAVDRSQVVATGETVITPAGTFRDCVHVRDSSAIERGSSHKWYAAGIGLVKDDEFTLVRIERAPPRP